MLNRVINNTAVGWVAIMVGLLAAITPVWASPSPVAAGFTLGLGAMAIIYGVWSLLARDRTRNHWALSVVGLVLGISPWVGMFADERAAWAAWICGLVLLSIGGAAYVRDETDDVAETERVHTMAAYMAEHPHEDMAPRPPQSSSPKDTPNSPEGPETSDGRTH